MSTQNGRARDRASREKALVDAALEEFAEKGFSSATTRSIALRAGCAEGLIHRYFGGKRGLLVATMQRQSAAAMQEAIDLGTPTGHLREVLEGMFDRYIDVLNRHHKMLRVSLAEALVDPDLARGVGKMLSRRRAARAEEVLRPLQDRGEISADIDLLAVGEMIAWLALIIAFLELKVFEEDEAYVRKMAKAATEIIAKGISAQ